MAREPLIPARKFLRLLDYMQRIGLDADAMLRAAGVGEKELTVEAKELPGKTYSVMYREAVRQMQTLRRPIPWAAGIGSEAFELMCYSIISCKTLGDALRRAQRFDELLYPMIGYRMKLEVADSLAEIHYQVRTEAAVDVFAPEDWDRAEHTDTVAHASGLLIWFGLGGWLIGRSIDLESVHIGGHYVSDDYAESLRAVFHCPVEFDAPENKICLSADYLERRLVHTADSLQEFLANAIYELIVLNSKPASTSSAIRSLIKLDFDRGLPSFEQMASSLHMSESSLRRRLLKEDTSYQNIKDQVRCEVALEHLRRDDIKINDLAELLGFTEPSSFVRSFRGWMGVTPKAYRDSLKR